MSRYGTNLAIACFTQAAKGTPSTEFKNANRFRGLLGLAQAVRDLERKVEHELDGLKSEIRQLKEGREDLHSPIDALYIPQ